MASYSQEKMGFYLSSTLPSNLNNGVANPLRIQEYLAPAPEVERNFDVFTAYDKDSKTYSTVAVDFPTRGTLTVWTSSISGTDAGSMKATPILSGVQINVPLPSGPAPLNINPLKLSKVVSGPNGGLLAIFTNGEVHVLDVNNKQFTLLHKLISDERALAVDHPTTRHGHVFDSERNGLWSIVSGGMFSYVIFTDFKTNSVGEWLQLDANMKLDPGANAVTTDFSPEWFINAMMVDAGDGKGNQLMVEIQSVSDDVGFDLLTFVNTTSGLLNGPVYNLMNYEIVLQCQSYNCDTQRNSAYDPVSKSVYFQGHSESISTAGNIVIGALGFDILKNGMPSYYVWQPNPNADFGYVGYQYYNF